MVSLNPPVCDFGQAAINFSLPGTDGEIWTLERVKGRKGTLILFICNHCPYVKAVADRIVRDARELEPLGVKTLAISCNDADSYPEDSFKMMKYWAKQWDFGFPYLYDKSQDIAKKYGAVCTPDLFGYNADLQLQYRGRVDESGKQAVPGARRELFDAMKLIAETGQGPIEQFSSIGCSIKWRD